MCIRDRGSIDDANHLFNPPYGSSLNITNQVGFQLNHKITNSIGSNLLTFGSEYIIDDVFDEINNFNSKKNKLLKIEDLDLYNDFEGVAAFLKSLDMFVTISNSTAHLAGSLGVKTILIKPDNYALFHYWNQKNNKTPWYNCIELIDRESFLNGSTNLADYLDL